MKSRSKSIQILRGISVLSIVLYHGFPKTFNAGYLGVDLFFLISGFVIAPKIERIIHSDDSWREMKTFFVSRFWRLTPALLITLIFSLLLILFLGGIGYIKNSLLQAFFSSIALGNLSAYYFLGNYFQPIPNPLIHTWSLSLEEQIYIFTPLMFLLLSRLFKVKKVAILYFLMFSISLLFLFLAPKLAIERYSFYSPVTRYWEFCLGAVIFFASRNSKIEIEKRNSRRKLISYLLFVLMVYLLFFGPHNPLFIFLLIVVFFKSLLFSLENKLPKSLVVAGCFIGDRSYSIYLVHMPIIWIFSYSPIVTLYGLGERNPVLVVFSILLTFLIGQILYKSIESKYRDSSYRLRIGDRAVNRKLIMVIICLFGTVTAGLLAESRNFWLERTVLNRPLNEMDFSKNEKCYLMNGVNPCIYGSNEKTNTLLIGDSHAGSIALTLRDIVVGREKFHTFLFSGCQFISNRVSDENSTDIENFECIAKSNKVMDYVRQNKFEKIYVSYRSTSLIPLGLKISELKYRSMLFQSLLDLQATCSCKITLIGPTPEFPITPDYFSPHRLVIMGNETAPRFVKRELMRPQPFEDDNYWKDSFDDSNDKLKYISMINSFCGQSLCKRWDNGWLFSDADHLSTLGADSVSGTIRQHS